MPDVHALLDVPDFEVTLRALVATLVLAYAEGLAARPRRGKPLVSDLAARWQQRILEALHEKMAEDFESFREAYMRPSFDL